MHTSQPEVHPCLYVDCGEPLYQVQATRTVVDGQWSTTTQLPTFLLDSAVLGITSVAHAEKIARDIIGGDECSITVHKLEFDPIDWSALD